MGNGVCEINKIWHRGDEDDAQTLNTRIAQRNCTIPHLMMRNNRNILEYYNNIHQGASHTGKQMSACALDLGDTSHVTCL